MSSSTPGSQTTLDAFRTITTEPLPPLPERVETPTERHQQQLIDRSIAHARTVDLAIDVDTIAWEVSTNAQRTRRAGDCRYNRATDQLTITLTWAAYVAWDWDEFAKTVRHELIHAYQFATRGQSDHGTSFKLLAQSVDAHVHCKPFTTGRLLIRCVERCEEYRSKASKVVKHPGAARCRAHDATMTVKHIATGRTWTDNEGYERQRAAIERASDAEW
jgi:predicted SprT family Zn-dependent metalloprotease